MQKPIHPHRYRETMSAAIARLDNIAVRTELAERLEIEFSGLSQAELAERRRYLNHIERLIANWISDGCQAFDVVTFMDKLVESECLPFSLESKVGDSVTYVHFGKTDCMALQSRYANFIDGFYFREIVGDGSDALQITFVCNGPEWNELENTPYGHALRAASQIAICAIPNGSVLPDALDVAAFHGDDELILDNVIPLARRVVRNVIAILQARPDLRRRLDLEPWY